MNSGSFLNLSFPKIVFRLPRKPQTREELLAEIAAAGEAIEQRRGKLVDLIWEAAAAARLAAVRRGVPMLIELVARDIFAANLAMMSRDIGRMEHALRMLEIYSPRIVAPRLSSGRKPAPRRFR